MRILYIDDDIEDIEIFAEAIHAVNPAIEFSSARSGREALTLLYESEPMPSHIVLDVNMPGMDGKSCLREIRAEEKFNDIKIFVYSTNSFPGDIAEMESLGATFMRKANSFNDLCDMIRGMIAD
ncbi:MAG TPA: response regulator [Chryseosolibacter sp.]|nr:response regulator [Chryseosolibacter sp.]